MRRRFQEDDRTFLYFSGEATTVKEKKNLYYDSGQIIGIKEDGGYAG